MLSVQVYTIAAGLSELPANIAASLANKLPAASTTSGSISSKTKSMVELLPQLDRLNFPKTKHWTPELYLHLKAAGVKDEEDDDIDLDDLAPGSSANGGGSKIKTSITSCYMEDENGEQQSKTSKDAARATARAFWVKLLNDKKAPKCFGEFDVDLKHEYILLMETIHPWLRLCENHWKTERIGHNHYSQWYSGAVKKQAKEAAAKAAAEGKVIDVDADNNRSHDGQETNSKRPQPDDETINEPKRRRLDKAEPVPSSEPITITTRRARVRFFISFDCIPY